MPALPAICNSCGNVFPSSFVVENASGNTFTGCTSGPCPRCGGVGRIPDGVYNVIGETIEILQRGPRSAADIQRLIESLRRMHTSGATAERVREELTREAPELKTIADALPKTRSELYAFLAILLTALTLLPNTCKGESKSTVELNQVINVFNEQSQGSTQGGTVSPSPTAVAPAAREKRSRPGRNDPCPCGSGKKYKKCHLQLQ